MNRRLIIDAETYLYTAAAGASYEVQWAWDDWQHWTELGTAKRVFAERVHELQEAVGCDSPVLAFGHRENFRYAVMPSYKRKRRNLRRPAGYKQLLEWAIETYDGIQLRGCEGDDVVGVMARYEDVIASTDKDLQTIPGHHLVNGEVQETSQHYADMAHLGQTLSGDDADGYPGCPKVGRVGAMRLLEGCMDVLAGWQVVVEAFQKAGLTEEDALRNARVARILRPREYDHVCDVPLLWQPPVACSTNP
jgi:DNA polymerase-1